MNTYRILADTVFWFHLVWVVLLVSGGFIAMKYKWFRQFKLIAVMTTIVSQLLFLGCPLSALENALRVQYDPTETFTGSFVCYYLKMYFGFQLPPEYIILALVTILIISAFVCLRHPVEHH